VAPTEVLAYCHSVLQVLRARLPTLYKHCVICDGQLSSYATAPSVCSAPLCAFAHTHLRVWATAVGCERVHQLCWNAARNAICSARPQVCLRPWPVLADEAGKLIPLPQDQAKPLQVAIAGARTVIQALSSPDALCRSVARWAMYAHQTHVVPMGAPLLGSHSSFHVVCHSPEREASFAKLQANDIQSDPSTPRWVFHGTPAERLHRILHEGLRTGTADNGLLLHGKPPGRTTLCRGDPVLSRASSRSIVRDRNVLQPVAGNSADVRKGPTVFRWPAE